MSSIKTKHFLIGLTKKFPTATTDERKKITKMVKLKLVKLGLLKKWQRDKTRDN